VHGQMGESPLGPESLSLDLFLDCLRPGILPFSSRPDGPPGWDRLHGLGTLHRGSGVRVRLPVLQGYVLRRVSFIRSGHIGGPAVLATPTHQRVLRRDLRGGLVVAGGDVAILPPVVPSWVAGAKALAAMVQASSEWRFESRSVIVIRPSDSAVLDDGRWVHAERI
jgi:hypothetical protein